MVLLDKNTTLFERDEKGELIPREIELETLEGKPKVKVTPLTRGELRKVSVALASEQSEEDLDGEIIEKHCIEPKYTKEEIKFMKQDFVLPIVTAILSVSIGMTQKEVNEKSKAELLKKTEENLQKK